MPSSFHGGVKLLAISCYYSTAASVSPKAPTVGVLPMAIPGLIIISPRQAMNMTHTKKPKS